jgi:hypothetical protein
MLERMATLVSLSFLVAANGADQPLNCTVARHGAQIELQSPAFSYTLDTAQGLRAASWQNHLAGHQISLGFGSEIALDFDTADQRIPIAGWKHQGDRRTTHFSCRGKVGGQEVLPVAVAPGPGSPAVWSWEAWRILLPSASNPDPIDFEITARTPADVQLRFAGHFTPAGER